MKRQKRGKCKLWRSFTNIFRRRRSTDEDPQPPFTGVPNDFPPPRTTEEEKIQPTHPVEVSKAAKKPASPIKQKPLPKPAGQNFAGDLDAVGRVGGLVNTDFAKDRIKIKPKNRAAPGKYNHQKQSFESESPSHSLEDLTTVRTESQDESQNSKDDNSAIIRDYALGELSSGSDTAERSAKVALLPKKPLPETPYKKPKEEETKEPVEFIRIPSKKKVGSFRSDEAKKFQPNSSGNEKSADPEIVNLSISESQNKNNRAESETEIKATKEAAKATELSGAFLQPETKPKSNKLGVSDSKIRLSVSMKEVKRPKEKDAQSGADDAIAESKSKASTGESSKLSSSVKERKVASKAESLNVETAPEAQAKESSTLESKSKAAKHEAALPTQGSFRKLSKTDKAAKATHDDLKGEKTESNPPEESNSDAKMGQENSLKRPQRKESKLKAEGKRESVHAPLTESNFKRNSSRRSSDRKSGQIMPESHDVDAESTAKNFTRENSKKITEKKKETQKRVDPVDRTSMLMPGIDLPEAKEILTGKSSGEAQKAVDQPSNDLQVNVPQELHRGSKLIEGQSLSDDKTAEPISVADSRESKGQEDVNEVKREKKSNQEVSRNGSSRKPDFVTPAVPGKALQKGKDNRNSIHKDMQTAAVTETEIKRQLPTAENAADEANKRMSKVPDEGGMKEFNKVLQKVQNKNSNASNESATTSIEASSPTTKTENKFETAISTATENGNVKPVKTVPVPPKANRGNASRNDLGGSQKIASSDSKSASSSADSKSASSANLSASLSSNKNSNSRPSSITSGESKVPSENAEAEKSKGDVAPLAVKTKGPPPAVVSRTGKVQPKGVENAKEPDAAWIGKAKRMSRDFGDKMLQKVEIKTEESKADSEVKTDDNFERGGEARSSVRDMIKKLQKQSQAS